MKKIILLFILFNITVSGFSQINPDIVDPDKIWSSLESQPWSPPPMYMQTYFHKFEDDTTINQLNYLKVWQTDDENQSFWTHIGYIRSTDESEVYFMNLQNEEGLLYKFDVAQGDIFTIKNTCFWIGMELSVEVLEVDSIFVSEANQYLKRIKLSDPNMPNSFFEYWIEGVGSLAGILWCGNDIYPLTGAEYNSLCLWQDGNLMFTSPGYPDCFYTTVSIEELIENDQILTISPNPLINQSFISFNSKNFDNGILEIRDMFGNLVRKITFYKNNKILLQREQLKSGIYIITMFNGNKLVEHQKLLVL